MDTQAFDRDDFDNDDFVDEEYADNYDHAQEQVNQLTTTLFVFHAYQNLSAIGPDGIMWNLDAKRLDVSSRRREGTIVLERLQLLPITATQKPVIDNKTGFSVSNVFVGSQGAKQQGSNPAQGVGSGLMMSRNTNVKGEFVFPAQKIAEMIYGYGKYGLVRINSLSAHSKDEEQICRNIFRAVMSGIPQGALLEDLPEYFAEEFYPSDYLPRKQRFGFKENAYKVIARVFEKGFDYQGRHIRLPAHFYDKAYSLISEIEGSVLQAHVAALDPEQGGVLYIAKDLVSSKSKKGYDRCDQWFMREFPSYPMDSEVEKANTQILRVLENQGDAPQEVTYPSAASVPFDDYKRLQEQNMLLLDRLGRLEQMMVQPSTVQQPSTSAEPQVLQPEQSAETTEPTQPVQPSQPSQSSQPTTPTPKARK